MKQVRISLILIAALLLSLSLFANNPEKPEAEIKETQVTKVAKAERPLVTSFFGGMILTKITLESQNSFVPYAYDDDADYAERCESLSGLVVFHRADKKDKTMPSGMYVWDGEQWQKISSPLIPQGGL